MHSLFPNHDKIVKLDNTKYFKARLANTLEYPVIVQWVGSLMDEIDVTLAAPVLYTSNIYFVRAEWGPIQTLIGIDYCIVRN